MDTLREHKTPVQRPVRILIVDDDQSLVRLFWMMLAKNGFEIMTAFDGHVALEEVHEVKPDLVLLDIMLPGGLNGIEVCRQLRADPSLNGVSVVMVSAIIDAEVRMEAIRAGANDYWIKPVSPNGLTERVQAALDALRPSVSQPVTIAGVQGAERPAPDLVKMLAELGSEDLEEVRALVAAKLARRGGLTNLP